MEKVYAQALENTLAKGTKPEAAVANLVRYLKAEGKLKMLPSIVRELKRLEAHKQSTGAQVEVAHKKDEAHALKESQTLGITATEAHVNKELLSGWRARKAGVLIDRSGKRGLIDLYRNVTKH